ncbi:MAG: hypothetical protein ACFFCS_25385 [Candidatus Hodarchaeota archaeon]
MSDITVLRHVNMFYYLCFIAYTVIFLILIIPRRKRQPFLNAFKIFLATSVVLLTMEFYGTFSGIRVFDIHGGSNVWAQLLLQLVMSIGEGGTATAIIYLMVESIYNKNYKSFFIYLSTLAVVMLTFASFTFFLS